MAAVAGAAGLVAPAGLAVAPKLGGATVVAAAVLSGRRRRVAAGPGMALPRPGGLAGADVGGLMLRRQLQSVRGGRTGGTCHGVRRVVAEAGKGFGAKDLAGPELPDVQLPPPPTAGAIEVKLPWADVQSLNVAPFRAALADYLTGKSAMSDLVERRVYFTIEFPREEGDPRELCEVPEIRLWFLRLDQEYPWIPIVLDWRSGELARYAAMLVPHQVKRTTGITFNPEALELFMTGKLMVAYKWLVEQGTPSAASKVKDMMQVVGYNLDPRILITVADSYGLPRPS